MSLTLLIADADAELCELYEMFLTKNGYDVETASDGLDCLRKLRLKMPAALVLDLELRWGGGDGVLDWVRQERSTHGIPVILTATAGRAADFAEFVGSPVVDCLHKPFAPTVLLESVRSAVARNGQCEPANPQLVPTCSKFLIS